MLSYKAQLPITVETEHDHILQFFNLRHLLIHIQCQITPSQHLPRNPALLLQPHQRPEENHAHHTEQRRKSLERKDKQIPDMRHNEFHKLGDLVQILLLGDVIVCALAIGGVFLLAGCGGKIQDGGESDRGDVEGDEPDGEDLGHGHVEFEVILVVCCVSSS